VVALEKKKKFSKHHILQRSLTMPPVKVED